MEGLFLVLLGVAALISLAVGIWWLVAAFKVHVGWGIAFLVPCVNFFAWIVFLFKHWDEAKKPFLVSCLSVFYQTALAGGGIYHSFKDIERQRAENPELTSETLVMPPYFAAIEKLPLVGDDWEESYDRLVAKRLGGEPEEAESAEEADEASETVAEGETKEPQSGLGKIMAKAKATLEKADARAKESGAAVEAASEEKAAEAKETAAAATKEMAAAEAKEMAAAVTKEAETKPADAAEEPVVLDGNYPKAPAGYRVLSLIGTENRRTAMITAGGGKSHLVAKGDNLTVTLSDGGSQAVEIVDITAEAVIIQLRGKATPMAIYAPKPKE